MGKMKISKVKRKKETLLKNEGMSRTRSCKQTGLEDKINTKKDKRRKRVRVGERRGGGKGRGEKDGKGRRGVNVQMFKCLNVQVFSKQSNI